MSIEAELQALTKAVTELTAETKSLRELRGTAIEAVQSAGNTGKTTAPKTTAPKADKPKADKPKEKSNISDSPEDRKDPSNDYDVLKEAIGNFVGMDDDEELVQERRAVILKIFAHPKIGAKKHTEVPEAMVKVVLNNIEKQTPDAKAKSEAKAAEAGESEGSDDEEDLLG